MTALQQAKQLHRTFLDWFGEGGKPAPNAQSRASQCLSCPWHEERPWEEFYKGIVAAGVRRQLELRSKMKLTVEGEDKLHLCGICKCVLKVKVHTPLHIARENTPDWEKMPSWCWMRWAE